jgi:hypothetical protein
MNLGHWHATFNITGADSYTKLREAQFIDVSRHQHATAWCAAAPTVRPDAQRGNRQKHTGQSKDILDGPGTHTHKHTHSRRLCMPRTTPLLGATALYSSTMCWTVLSSWWQKQHDCTGCNSQPSTAATHATDGQARTMQEQAYTEQPHIHAFSGHQASTQASKGGKALLQMQGARLCCLTGTSSWLFTCFAAWVGTCPGSITAQTVSDPPTGGGIGTGHTSKLHFPTLLSVVS